MEKMESGACGDDVAADVVALVEERLRAGARAEDAVPLAVREGLGLLDAAPAVAALRALARGVLPRMRVGRADAAPYRAAQACVLAALVAAHSTRAAVAAEAARLLAHPDECARALALVDAVAPHCTAVVAAGAPADAAPRLCAVAACLGAAADAPDDATALRRGVLLHRLASTARARTHTPLAPTDPRLAPLRECAATLTRLGRGASTFAQYARQAAAIVTQMLPRM